MKKLTIIGSEAKDIQRDIHKRISYQTETYKDMNEILTALEEHPISTNILMFTDTGISADAHGQYQGKADLKKLVTYVTFKADRIIYLNKSTNKNLLESVDFILKEYATAEIEIYSEDAFRIERVKEIVLSTKFLKEKEPVMGEVIIKKRGSKEVSAELIGESNITAPKVIYHPLAMVERPAPPRSRREISSDVDLDRYDGDIEDRDYSIDILRPERKIKEKIIAVTGIRGSGVTSTAFTLANTLSELHKVLIVDLNVYNLGLSHIVTKVENEKLFRIDLPKIIARRFDKRPSEEIKNMVVNGKTLHCLTLDRDLFELACMDMVILNIIDMVGSEYDYIVLDIPLIEESPYLLNLPDLFILCAPPFPAIVEETRRVFSNVTSTLNDKRKVLIRIGTKQNISPVSQEYIKDRVGIPVTGVLTLKQDYMNPALLDII